jgi:hypothetical protein
VAAISVAGAYAVAVYAAPPANDNFANRAPISGASGTALGNNVDATSEPGERPLAGIESATNTVWWQWTAPADGWYGLDTFGSLFNTVLAVFRGDQVQELVLLDDSDDATLHSGLVTFQSFLRVPARAGEVYQIAVAGKAGWAAGDIQLNWYPDTYTWLETHGVSTDRVQNVMPARSGHLLHWHEQYHLALVTGTNRGGVTIWRLATEWLVEDLTHYDRRHVVVASSARLNGMGPMQEIEDFDGRRLVVRQDNDAWILGVVNTLHVLTSRRGMFQPARFTQAFSNRVTDALFRRRRLFVSSFDSIRIRHSGCGEFRRNLKRAVWWIPNSPGTFEERLPNGLVVRHVRGTPDRVDILKHGRRIASHALPAVPHNRRVEFRATQRGGLVYWSEGMDGNGPLTYVDRRGRAVFSGLVPTGLTDFNGAEIHKRLLLLHRWDIGGLTLQVYKLGRTPRLLGQVIVANAHGPFFIGSSVAVARESGGMTGLRVYDRRLRRIRWETSAPGDGIWPLGGSTHAIVRSDATIFHLTVYRRTREIARHSFAR